MLFSLYQGHKHYQMKEQTVKKEHFVSSHLLDNWNPLFSLFEVHIFAFKSSPRNVVSHSMSRSQKRKNWKLSSCFSSTFNTAYALALKSFIYWQVCTRKRISQGQRLLHTSLSIAYLQIWVDGCCFLKKSVRE